MALADLILTGGSASKPGRPEYLVVVDADTPDQRPVRCAEFSIPVEIPWRVLAELAGDADVHTVVVRNGVVLHAPGNLDLGRTTRLANRAQRRALRGLYATCAIPGCGVRYDHCKLHHVIWWRHGGCTDLDNLLPVCSRHHHNIHDSGLGRRPRTQPATHHPLPRRHHPNHRPTHHPRRLTVTHGVRHHVQHGDHRSIGSCRRWLAGQDERGSRHIAVNGGAPFGRGMGPVLTNPKRAYNASLRGLEFSR